MKTDVSVIMSYCSCIVFARLYLRDIM